MKTNIKLAIVDDHQLFVDGIKSILESIADFEVIFTCNDGPSTINALSNHSIDILLLDLEMKPMDGMQVFHEVKEHHPNINVIILTMHEEPELIAHLMRDGISAYLMKDTKKLEFESAIRKVYRDGLYFNDHVSMALLKETLHKNRNKKPKIGPNVHLTSREVEVLELIAREFTTQEIGEKLFLSPKTVEGHRKSLLQKFHAKNSTGLIIKAIEKDILSVPFDNKPL